MKITLDLKSGLPIYLQIVEQVKHKIAAGELSVGEKLPTVRQLATELEINPNTVVKAYTELERTGIIESKQGVGTFIKKEKGVLSNLERDKKLQEICRKFTDEALWFGYSEKEIFVVLKKILKISEKK
jgi:GntR family transcriptional regulator